MKDWIKIIDQQGHVIFSGNILDLPIQNQYIIKRSIELFDDPDPCIIHKSYVIRKIVEEIKVLLQVKDQTGISLSKYGEELHFLELSHLDTLTMFFGVK
jgi:hypothetical protein